MTSIPIHNYLVVAAGLFALGLIGFLSRRNFIIMFLSAEMMLQGVALNLLAFGRMHGNLQGQAFALFIVTVAACEAALALALLLTLYQKRRTLDVQIWQDLREANLDATTDDEPLPLPPPEKPLPKLPSAGREPRHKPEESHV
jgi:NADH-quinone oxidoreductase subunit K